MGGLAGWLNWWFLLASRTRRSNSAKILLIGTLSYRGCIDICFKRSYFVRKIGLTTLGLPML
jgi:hypothetical protein